MKPTITFTTKKEIKGINLPKSIRLKRVYNQLHLVVQSLYNTEKGCLLNKELLREWLEENLDIVTKCVWFDQVKDTYIITLKDGITCEIDSSYTYHDTYIFYKNHKETIELTSYEQGCAVLSDIFTPMG